MKLSKIISVLIAPNDSPVSSSPRSLAGDVFLNYLLIGVITGLVVYTLLLGTGLMAGRVPVERAYALMSVPPFLTAAWQMLGFVRQPGARGSMGDNGLLVGAIGWLAAGVTLLIMHASVTSGLAAGRRIDQIQPPTVSWLVALIAVVGIAGGTFLSWQTWQKLEREADTY